MPNYATVQDLAAYQPGIYHNCKDPCGVPGCVGHPAWAFVKGGCRVFRGEHEAKQAACAGCSVPLKHDGAPCINDRCPIVRRKREAPLMALVNAVPEGLDANGWRAAVLAAAEKFTCPGRYPGIPQTAWKERLVARLSHPYSVFYVWKQEWNGPYVSGAMLDAVSAYDRATTPHKAPPPERRSRRDPYPLVCDLET